MAAAHPWKAMFAPKYQEFEKPDIVDVLEYLGVFDLTIRDNGDGRPYLNGPCPFHESDSGNVTSFVVWPSIQRCACMSCSPVPMDVIDLWRKAKGVDFATAIQQIGMPITQESALLKRLQAEVEYNPVDLRFYAERIQKLFDRLDYGP